MSEYEHYTGKLKEIPLSGESLEKYCKDIANEHGISALPIYYDSFLDCVDNQFYDEYIVVNKKLYKYLKCNKVLDVDVFHANFDKEGNIDFECTYYDGGCDFSEAIEEAIKNIDRITDL